MDPTILRQVDFPSIDREGWAALVEKALGDGGSIEDLVSETDDGIRIEPLYQRVRGARPVARLAPDKSWDILQRVDDPDPARANKQVREDLENGARGLSLVFAGAPNAFGYGLPSTPEALAAALDGVMLNNLHLRIDVHPQSRASIDWLAELLSERRADPSRMTLSFGIDPSALFAGTGRLRMSIEALEASMPQSLAGFFAIGLPGVLLEADGRVFHNAGASEAQELGVVLSSAVSHLRMFEEARQPLVYAAPHIGFALAVDQDQIVSIAKIRALRRLWARVLEACSIEAVPTAVHAETSYRMMTHKDPETNILRSTIATFAAAVGGADSISVLPHTITHGLPDGFARRLARNTQIVLANESHIGFVTDPVAGSGAVEALTEALCEKGWEEFKRIEAEGGVLRSLAAGHIQERLRTMRERRAERYRSGERAIIGTTLYQLETERPVNTIATEPAAVPSEGAVFCEHLAATRIDQVLGPANL
jgi:methylmalonyl-CoA mutase